MAFETDYTQPRGTGYGYGGVDPAKMTKTKNALSDDEISKLIQKENQFSLAITENERLRAICTHRFQNGMDALIDIGDGMQRCQICGHEFMPVSPYNSSKEDIKGIVEQAKDVLQTIKLIYLDMPAAAAREFFVVIALLDKIPDLFEAGCKDYIRHEKFMPGTYNGRAANILSIYNMITGGVGPETYMQYDANGMPINPGFDPNSAWAYGNPAYGGQAWGPMMNNGMASFGSNGFVGGQANVPPYGYAASGDPNAAVAQPGYTAATTDYKYDPAKDPNANAEVKEVQATFKP